MARRIPILLLGLCLRILPADAGVLNICNEGNVTINTAVVERSLSGWRVSGWYPVPAHKCEVAFHTSFANVLLGFTYRDANKVMRVHVSVPSKREYDIYDMSETFCVKVEDQFEYESRERPATTCRAGYAPLMFGVGVRLTNVARATYTTTPRVDEGGRRLVVGTVEVAELLTGVPVQRDGRVWKHRDGRPLSDSLINPKIKKFE